MEMISGSKMKSKAVCVAMLALLIMPCYVQAGLFDGLGKVVSGEFH